jgi:hypothetical protein
MERLIINVNIDIPFNRTVDHFPLSIRMLNFLRKYKAGGNTGPVFIIINQAAYSTIKSRVVLSRPLLRHQGSHRIASPKCRAEVFTKS